MTKAGVGLQVVGPLAAAELDDGRASSSYVIWHNNAPRTFRSTPFALRGQAQSLASRARRRFNELDGILCERVRV